ARTFPTAEEPVKDTAATSGCSQRRRPTAGVVASDEGRTLRTPGGKPASSDSWARASADRGVSGAGLMTHVQPAASAAPIFLVIMALGKFHCTFVPSTPIGCLMKSISFPLTGEGT
ncbi:unnamed protein product, partial [Ixodes persulcatus]